MGGVKHDYLTVADTKPQASEVDRDEIVINEADGSMWSKNQSDVVIKLGGSSGGSGHVIQDDGTPMVNRANLNLVGFTVEDDAGNDATKITNTSIARPILTGPASEFMGQAIVITVTNWFTGHTYDWTNLDSVVDNDDGTFSGVLPDVVEDDVAWTITAVAKQDGLLPSPIGTHVMENKLQIYTEALELDINQSNINDTSFPTRDGIDTAGGELTGTEPTLTTLDNGSSSAGSLVTNQAVYNNDELVINGTDLTLTDAMISTSNSTTLLSNQILTENGTIITSSGLLSTTDAYRLYDGTPSTPMVGSSVANAIVNYRFDVFKTIHAYTLQDWNSSGNASNTQAPNSFDLLGSNNGTDYTLVDSRTGITWYLGEKKTFTCASADSYLYYRLHLKTNNGHATFLSIGEAELLGELIYTVDVSSVEAGIPSQSFFKAHTLGQGTAVSSDITDGSTVIKKADDGAVVIHHSEHECVNISSDESTVGILNSTDPFGDGSLISKWQFLGDSSDLLGVNDGTDSNMIYGTDTAVFNGLSSKITVSSFSPVSMSFSFTPNTLGLDALMGNSGISGNYIYWGASIDKITINGVEADLPKVIGTNVKIGLVNNGTDVDVYMNGNYISTALATNLATYNELGARTSGSSQWANGIMGQLEYYNTSKTSNQMKQLANQGATTDLVTLVPIADGDNLAVVKDDLSIVPYDNISGTIETNTLALLDVLGDGSCLHAFNFDGDASSIDNTTTASTIGTPTYSSGTFGQKIELLDGSTTAVDTGISAPSGSFAISGYFTWEADTGGNACVSSNNNANSYTRGFSFGFHTTAGLFVVVGNGGSQQGSAQDVSSLITVGNTYFLRFEYDETEARLYADGTLMATATYSGMTSGHSNIFIARQADNYTNRHGSISVDQLRFFNKTLTSNEDSFIGKELYYTYTLDPTISEVPSRVFAVDNKVEYKMDDGTGYQEATRLVDTNTYNVTLDSTDPFGDASLVNKYLMEDDATDLVGNTNGTLNNGTYVTGKFGKGISLTGVSASNFSTNKAAIAGAYSSSLWFKTTTGGYILSEWTNSNGFGLYDSIANGEYATTYYTGSTAWLLGSGDLSLMDDEWHHAVVTFDGTTGVDGVNLYIDGVLAGSTQSTASILGSGNKALNIGGSGHTNSYYNGEVDHLEIYNRALTSSEVSSLYSQSKLRVNRTHNPVTDATGSTTLNTRVTAKAIGNKIKAVNAALFE